MSSIFKIILAHSVAKLNADVVTNSGCKTFSFLMSLTVPFFTLMPSWTLPNMACLFLNSVTISIGFNPAFSAKVYGITSNASAKAFTQTDSIPDNVRAHCPNLTGNRRLIDDMQTSFVYRLFQWIPYRVGPLFSSNIRFTFLVH